MQDGGDDMHRVAAGADYLVRQYQNAVTLPFMRVHKMHGIPRFPWLWGNQSHLTAFREALNLRYRLIPFIYSLAHRAQRYGIPIARPASHVFGTAGEARSKSGAEPYMLGDAMLPADFDRIERVGNDANVISFTLPTGIVVDEQSSRRTRGASISRPLVWYAFGTAGTIEGNDTKLYTESVPLSVHPIFVRAGAIVPLHHAEAMIQHTAELGGSLDVHIYGGDDATFEMVEDDGATDAAVVSGENATRTTTWTWIDATSTLTWNVVGDYGTSIQNTTKIYTNAFLYFFNLAGDSKNATIASLGQSGSHTFA
jgi:alpha-glucosidase (family GH31 glycosyl hydrolase)